MNKSIKLKVAESCQDDMNKNLIRIDSRFMRTLELNVGDIIAIEGKRKALAIIDKAYPSDFGVEIIRMDSTLRKNAKVEIGDFAILFKPNIVEAEKVILKCEDNLNMKKLNYEFFKDKNLGKAFSQNDLINMIISSEKIEPKKISKKDITNELEKINPKILDNPFASDLIDGIYDDFSKINIVIGKFKIEFTKPSGFVSIGSKTTIEVK